MTNDEALELLALSGRTNVAAQTVEAWAEVLGDMSLDEAKRRLPISAKNGQPVTPASLLAVVGDEADQ